MSDETPSTAAASEVPDFSSPGQQTPAWTAQEAAASGAAQAASGAAGAASRPEVILGGAFAAGFLLAKIIRRRGD